MVSVHYLTISLLFSPEIWFGTNYECVCKISIKGGYHHGKFRHYRELQNQRFYTIRSSDFGRGIFCMCIGFFSRTHKFVTLQVFKSAELVLSKLFFIVFDLLIRSYF